MSISVSTCRLLLHPVTISEANQFVKRHHRHHPPPYGTLFAIGCAIDGEDQPCGVVLVGRPVAMLLDDGWTAEVTRLCTLGQKNACSMLYRAAWRATKSMGYKRLITYILDSESGVSLRASGAKLLGCCGGGTWNRPNSGRPRVDKHPTQKKLKWEFSD